MLNFKKLKNCFQNQLYASNLYSRCRDTKLSQVILIFFSLLAVPRKLLYLIFNQKHEHGPAINYVNIQALDYRFKMCFTLSKVNNNFLQRQNQKFC